MSVAAALVKAQKAFGPALKSSTNPHFKSKYADLAACVEAVIDALNANGIYLLQRQHPVEGGVGIETIFVHESGEQLSAGVFQCPASKQDPQGYGSATTYARRYSLMAACGIAPEDDDGNAASKKPAGFRATDPVVESIPPDERAYLRELAAEAEAVFTRDGAAATVRLIKSKNLDHEQKIGLWSYLPAPMRRAIKEEEEAQHKVAKVL